MNESASRINRRLGCGIGLVSLAILYGLAHLLNEVTFAQAATELREWCEIHGGARARETIPSGSAIAFYHLSKEESESSPGCGNCPDYLDDPRGISVLKRDWRDNPYRYGRSPGGGYYLATRNPQPGDDWGPVGWYRFSLIKEGNGQCAGRQIDMFDQPLDAQRAFKLEWRQYNVCRVPAAFADADYIYGYHVLSEPPRIGSWWVPPILVWKPTAFIVDAKSREPVISVTNGYATDWLNVLATRLIPIGAGVAVKASCGPSDGLSPFLIGRHAAIFQGAKVQYDP